MSEELRTLKSIEELLRVLVRVSLADATGKHLLDKKHKLLYDLTGKLRVDQLSKKTGFSTGKISGIWQEWEKAGLLIKDGKQYKKVL